MCLCPNSLVLNSAVNFRPCVHEMKISIQRCSQQLHACKVCVTSRPLKEMRMCVSVEWFQEDVWPAMQPPSPSTRCVQEEQDERRRTRGLLGRIAPRVGEVALLVVCTVVLAAAAYEKISTRYEQPRSERPPFRLPWPPRLPASRIRLETLRDRDETADRERRTGLRVPLIPTGLDFGGRPRAHWTAPNLVRHPSPRAP